MLVEQVSLEIKLGLLGESEDGNLENKLHK